MKPPFGNYINESQKKLLSSAGIPPYIIHPTPIGKGGNHIVYRWVDNSYVVKFPINRGIGTVADAKEEQENIEYYNQYFGDRAIPTYYINPNGDPYDYFVLAKYIYGRRLKVSDLQNPYMEEQLQEILYINSELYDDTGKIIDLVGLEGLIPMIKAFAGINVQDFALTNLFIDNAGDIKIVDYDTVQITNTVNPLEYAKALFAYNLNSLCIENFFGLTYYEA